MPDELLRKRAEHILFVLLLLRTHVVDEQWQSVCVACVGGNADVVAVDDDVAALPCADVGGVCRETDRMRGKVRVEYGDAAEVDIGVRCLDVITFGMSEYVFMHERHQIVACSAQGCAYDVGAYAIPVVRVASCVILAFVCRFCSDVGARVLQNVALVVDAVAILIDCADVWGDAWR